MLKWIHRLLEPHCPQCAEERVCNSCETLRHQLDNANYEKRQLMDVVVRLTFPSQQEQVPKSDEPKAIQPKGTLAWKIRRGLLEAEDRRQAQIMREATERERTNVAKEPERGPSGGIAAVIEDKKQSIEELEKELGVNQSEAS